MSRLLWTQKQDTGPSPRALHGMAYDSNRKRVLLYGGNTAPYRFAGARGDTWEWDGKNWLQVAQFGPPPMNDHAMAFDSGRSRVVLVSSNDANTWEWDGDYWTQVADTGPNVWGSAMAYDVQRGRIAVFGGTARWGGGPRNETWEWNGTEWTQTAETGPLGRYRHTMVYDTGRKRLVLFGGISTTALFGDTWEWDGNAWEQVAEFGPSARMGHAMVYDPGRARTVLFGGADVVNGLEHSLKDTWEWDGKRWLQTEDMGPERRYFHAMAYDGSRHKVVLFGGHTSEASPEIELNDTWELAGL
jgi:hypothetical protein